MSSSTQTHRPPLHVKPDFEPHRATIWDLYIAKDLTLDQVMAIMEQRHGFRATEKQYKPTLKTWGFTKYVSRQAKDCILQTLESRDREGKKTASVKLGGALIDKKKIGRWRRERAKATGQFDTDHVGAWCEDSEMLDIEFVSEDEYRGEIMESTGAAPVASIGEDSRPPHSPHIITSANPHDQQRGGLGYQISRGTSDLFSMAIDQFERAWRRVDNLPVPDVDDNENYDLLGLEYEHIDYGYDDAFLSQPGLLSEPSDIHLCGILDSSWGYPGQFSKLPATAPTCGELGVVEATDNTNEDNYAEDIDGDNNYTQEITSDNNCTENMDSSEEADCAKDTDRVEGGSHQDLTTSLYRAVSEGDHRATELLLNLAKQLGRPFGDSVLLSALKTASIRGHATVLKLLLDLDVPTTNALREAAMAGRLEALPPLLDKGGYQPGALSFASRIQTELSQQDICRLLLEHEADVDEMSSETDEHEWGPPLLEAAMYNNSGVFTLLLNRGANLDLAMKTHRNKRPCARTSGFSHANLFDGTDDTLLDATKALFLVLREGDSKLAAVLTMCHGASNNDALVIAARYGDEAVAKRLLDGGADPFHPNSSGLSAIEAARRNHRTDFVKLLLCRNREPPHEMSLLRDSFALRARFISQCKNINKVAGRLPAHLAAEAEKLSRYFLDHRPAFCSAMSCMRGLSALKAPDNMCSLLAYLCLARAMTDLIRSRAGTDFTGAFQDCIRSFFEVLRYGTCEPDDEALLYEQVVRQAWGVELDQQSASLVSADENILRMQGLAAKLLFQSTHFMDSDYNIRADQHPLLGEQAIPGCTSPTAEQSTGFPSFDVHAPDLSSETFPPSGNESLNQPYGIAGSSKQDDRPPNVHAGERNAIDGGGIKAVIIRIATGALFALMILLLNAITHATEGNDPLSTFFTTACATQPPSTPHPDDSDTFHNSATFFCEDAPFPCIPGTTLSARAHMTGLSDPTLLSRPATPSMAEWTPNWSDVRSPTPEFAGSAHPMVAADSFLTTPWFSDRTI